MSANFLHAFADENPELRKQIGCMNGILQMFDRQLLLTRVRRLNGHGHKRNPSGHAVLTSASRGAENYACSPQEKGLSKSLNENHMESSRTYFSSSSCSSFSSPECSKSTQPEAFPFERTIYPDKSSINSKNLKTSDADTRRSLDFRDVVKDSINRDSQCSSGRPPREDVKHVDSPVRMQPPKSIQVREHTDLDESLRVLVKLKETPWSFSECGESPRPSFEAKVHRLSFDGKEVPRNSLDSREHNKLISQLREPPRLSLDGMEGSLKDSNFESDPKLTLKDSDGSTYNQELVSPRHSTSVIAKLMGLEAMPTFSMLTQDPAYDRCKDYDRFREPRLKPIAASQGNRDYSKMKPISNSRVPIEPAPWKKVKCRVPHKVTDMDEESHVKQQSESVYSEKERKLNELEFGQSNNELMALKQVLDAMHEKGLLGTKRDEQQATRASHTFEPPIVIMKPANSVKRSGVHPSSVIPLEGVSAIQKLQTHTIMDKNNSTTDHRVAKGQTFSARLKELSSSKASNKMEGNGSRKVRSGTVHRSQQSRRENVRSSLQASSSVNPRPVRKSPAGERARPLLPSLESSIHQRTSSNRKQLESVSPRNKLGNKPAKVQDGDHQLSENGETRNFSYLSRENSRRSESNGSLLSQVDTDVLHQGSKISSGRAARKAASIKKQKKPSITLRDASSIEFETAPAEQQSPVSILDASFNHDDLPPSPLKKSSNFSNDKNQSKNSSSKINEKLRNVENLVQKLNELSSTDDGLSATDHIAALCETGNPNHHYVSEILLTSGLLFEDLSTGPMGSTPMELEPSGHPINPDLFLVLEQTKPRLNKTGQEKLNRKVLFDAVNEILVKKLEGTSLGPHRFPRGQQVLKELCLEIDALQTEAPRCENYDNEIKVSKGWTNFEEEVPKVVLEIERSIFKDLVDDIVSGEAWFTSESENHFQAFVDFVK